MTGLLAKFDDVMALKYPITLVLDDAAGNSYVQVSARHLSTYNYANEQFKEFVGTVG
jgi:C4-type Zn-finger protein